MIDVMRLIFVMAGAVIGGFVGGWTVAFRIGRWRSDIEARVRANEERLKRGDAPVGRVPVLTERMEMVIEEIRDIKKMMTERLVTRQECDRRHEHVQERLG